MDETDDFLDVLQADVAATLAAVPQLRDAVIISNDEGDLDSKVERALETRTDSKTGKRGLVVIVMRPDVTDAEKNLPGPSLSIAVQIQTIEQVMFNRDSVRGTRMTSSQAAVNVLAALHLRSFGSRVLYADKTPIKSLPVTHGHLSRLITLATASDGIHLPRPAAVQAAITDGDLVLTGPSGCTIHYTTDGSFPSAPLAATYTAPIADIPAGTTVRAAAFDAALGYGDVLEFKITA